GVPVRSPQSDFDRINRIDRISFHHSVRFNSVNSVNSVKTPVFLAGATATGKSEVAILVAKKIGGEIVSVDSMQFYGGFALGTAKPRPADRARVPHHLIDVAELN